MQKIQFASYNCFCMAVPYCGLILIEKNPWNIDALAKIFSFVIRELLISGEKTVNLKTSHFPGVSFSVWQYPVEKWMRWSKYILLFLLIPDLSLNEKKKKVLQELLRRRLTAKQEAVTSPVQSVLSGMGPTRTRSGDSHHLSFFLWSEEINFLMPTKCHLPNM